MEIRVRDAEPTDWAVIAEFNQRLAEESEGKSLPWETLVSGVRTVLADAGRGRYFVAEVGGRIAGQTMITYEWSDWRNAWIWWIQSVYVHPDFRGHGVFSRLYRHIESARGAADDVCGLRLYVLQTNSRARAIYARLGMRPTGYEVLESRFDQGD
jgi:GNAT superfamily N-acetyltransferase